MRYLVLTDIHANLEAMEACLADAAPRGFDRTLVLGDLVGYCADPNAVVERVQALKPAAMVRGNHDKVACGLEQPDGFNAVARRAAHWTHDVLTPANRKWLADLPQGPVVLDELVEICHGSPFDEDAYIFDELDAVRGLKTSERPLCLFGHTHWPVMFEMAGGRVEMAGSPECSVAGRLVLLPQSKYLVNPGSVGQPRDGDPRAAYGLVDTTASTVELYRVDYAIETTQAKVIKAGLPEVLAQRLAAGR
jgi:diadenosine tetraphosphatase ApaH/serine/threonine PP2A family protein phosphatase